MGKRIWTFYGPDMKPWNLYGEANLATSKHQPLFVYEPVRLWYNGKIFPMNRIYSIWVATISQDGHIGQPYMKDLFSLWKAYRENPKENYSELALIKDDNNDGVPELNRPKEIQAFLGAMTRHLKKLGNDLTGKDVIVVSGSEYTADGTTWKSLPFAPKPWEYTPYSSVFKLSHDVLPAASALGAGGCTDCHSLNASFWTQKVMVKPFEGPKAETIYTTNAQLLGLSNFGVVMSAIRHQFLGKMLLLTILASIVALAGVFLSTAMDIPIPNRLHIDQTIGLMLGILAMAVAGPGLIVIGEEILSSQLVGILGEFHAIAGIVFVLAVFAFSLFSEGKKDLWYVVGVAGVVFMALTASVLFMTDNINARQIAFTLHDLGAVFLCAWAVLTLFLRNKLK